MTQSAWHLQLSGSILFSLALPLAGASVQRPTAPPANPLEPIAAILGLSDLSKATSARRRPRNENRRGGDARRRNQLQTRRDAARTGSRKGIRPQRDVYRCISLAA
jgi:hypothetical protein